MKTTHWQVNGEVITDNERIICEMVLKAMTYPAIAKAKGVSKNTMATEARTLYDKLRVHNKVELVIMLNTYGIKPVA